MRNANNLYDQNPLANLIDDPVIADADAPQIVDSRELLRARRALLRLKLDNSAQDALARARIERAKFAPRRRQ